MIIEKYSINEEIAKEAKSANSFSDYEPNEATNGYNSTLAKFNDIVDSMIKSAKNDITGKTGDIKSYCDRYSQRLADAINRENRIRAMYPSVMIAGAGHFNVAKKQKQNNAMDRFWEECKGLFTLDTYSNYYLKKIDDICNNTTIYSNDVLSVEKLETEINSLKDAQEKMKKINAFYRKNKTVDGCPEVTSEEIIEIKEKMHAVACYDIPFPPYSLNGNLAKIKRLTKRLEEIKRLKKGSENKYIAVDGLSVEESSEDMRIRLIFEDIPDGSVRNLLKTNGFRWSPKNKAWQRQLTDNGVRATNRLLKILQSKENE